MDKANSEYVQKKQAGRGRGRLRALFFRWAALAIIAAYYITGEGFTITRALSLLFAFSFIYNMLLTLYIIKKGDIARRKFSIKLISAVDIALISAFSAWLGGTDSDIYVLLFLVIGYCAMHLKRLYTIAMGLLSAAAYSILCIYTSGYAAELEYSAMVIRCVFILMAAFLMTLLNREVKKFGDLHKKEFRLARTDKLTGLANRHYFDQELGKEARRAIDEGKQLNILIFDLDNFKRFNDTYGHVWGDKLLILFSDIIKKNIGRNDIPVRYGGEEFVILIRELDIGAAKAAGDRIRGQLEKQRIYVGNDSTRKTVTVSCGLSQYPRHSPDIKRAVEMADKALYKAKESGKNIVVTYDEITA